MKMPKVCNLALLIAVILCLKVIVSCVTIGRTLILFTHTNKDEYEYEIWIYSKRIIRKRNTSFFVKIHSAAGGFYYERMVMISLNTNTIHSNAVRQKAKPHCTGLLT
jgi:hypothetical protein